MDDFNLDEFLNTVYTESKKGEVDNAINIVMDNIERLLGGIFEKSFNDVMESLGGPRILQENEEANPYWIKISEVLSAYDPWKADVAITVSFMSMCWMHKKHIPGYRDFVARARKRFLEEMEPEEVEGLIGRLG